MAIVKDLFLAFLLGFSFLGLSALVKSPGSSYKILRDMGWIIILMAGSLLIIINLEKLFREDYGLLAKTVALSCIIAYLIPLYLVTIRFGLEIYFLTAEEEVNVTSLDPSQLTIMASTLSIISASISVVKDLIESRTNKKKNSLCGVG